MGNLSGNLYNIGVLWTSEVATVPDSLSSGDDSLRSFIVKLPRRYATMEVSSAFEQHATNSVWWRLIPLFPEKYTRNSL